MMNQERDFSMERRFTMIVSINLVCGSCFRALHPTLSPPVSGNER